MKLTSANFFSYYVLHPMSPSLTGKEQRVALAASIALGVLTLGLYHIVCALVNYTFKWLPPGTITPSSGLFQERISPRPGTPEQESPETSPPDEVVTRFWLTVMGLAGRPLARRLEILLQREAEERAESGSPNWMRVASELVDYYVSFYPETDQTVLPQLKKQVAHNLEHWPYEPKRVDDKAAGTARPVAPYKVLQLSGDRRLGVYSTVGEGSCGFHALMGEFIGDGSLRQYRVPNIAQVRQEFCDYLRACYAKNRLPQGIKNALEEHFIHFNSSPPGFQTEAVRAKRREIFLRYPAILADDPPTVKAEKQRIHDALKEEFCTDEVVFAAYLTYLARVGSDLFQDELIAVADWQGVTIRLMQPGWGEDRLLAIDILNPGHETTVDIYYNGHNHYERAAFLEDER